MSTLPDLGFQGTDLIEFLGEYGPRQWRCAVGAWGGGCPSEQNFEKIESLSQQYSSSSRKKKLGPREGNRITSLVFFRRIFETKSYVGGELI